MHPPDGGRQGPGHVNGSSVDNARGPNAGTRCILLPELGQPQQPGTATHLEEAEEGKDAMVAEAADRPRRMPQRHRVHEGI